MQTLDGAGVRMERKRHAPTVEQLKRRAVALRGVLAGKISHESLGQIPRTLQQAKEWTAPLAGIIRIPSPNSFTRTSALYGNEVREIEQLCKDVATKFGLTGDVPPEPKKSEPLDTVHSLKGEILTMLGSYHKAKLEAEDASYLRTEVGRLTDIITKQDRQIAVLKQELARHQVRPVK